MSLTASLIAFRRLKGGSANDFPRKRIELNSGRGIFLINEGGKRLYFIRGNHRSVRGKKELRQLVRERRGGSILARRRSILKKNVKVKHLPHAVYLGKKLEGGERE